jgi:TRAP-type C4-dicarboxylate transport system substrate-binding protein
MAPASLLKFRTRHRRLAPFADSPCPPRQGIKRTKIVIKYFLRWALLAIVLLPSQVSAEPIKLKLSVVTSDRSLIYLGGVKPFVDAVNAEAKGLLEIEVYFSGALGKDAALQPQLVADGVADMAFIFPGYGPQRFYDDAVLELPGLFRDTREASLVFTRLIAAGALKGYEDFYVIGAFASPLESIHSRRPIASIADLKGMSVRVSNTTGAAALQRLGMRPVTIPVNLVSEAISAGTIDGAVLPPAMLFEFGVGRVTSYHYLLNIDVAPLALVMNRKKFDALPEQAKDIIREHSGEWPLASFVKAYDAVDSQVMEQLESNPKRKIVRPSQSDLDTAKTAFKSFVDEWAAKSPNNRKQLDLVQSEIAKLRASE